MRSIPDATAITLTDLERAELEALARSTKTEHRMRLKAQIVLMAADGAATWAIDRALGCTTDTGRNAGCAMRRIGLPVFRKLARAAPKPNMTVRRIAAFLRCSIRRRSARMKRQSPDRLRNDPGFGRVNMIHGATCKSRLRMTPRG